MSSTLPRLTSLSTQTLTLLLERQRLLSLAGSSNAAVSLPSSSLAQITRNLTQIRSGLQNLDEQQHNNEADVDREAMMLLREQYGRMREMLGADKEKVEPLRPLSPPRRQSKDEAPDLNTDPMATPYVDYPDSSRPYSDGIETKPFDSADILESQRLMMDEQDTQLNALHSSLTRQHSLSQQLSSELDVQAGLLTELDNEIDNTTSRLGRARKALDRVGRGIGTNGSTVTIALLILILLVLIIIFKT